MKAKDIEVKIWRSSSVFGLHLAVLAAEAYIDLLQEVARKLEIDISHY